MENSDHDSQLMQGQNIRKWTAPKLEKLGTNGDLRGDLAANDDGTSGDSNAS